MGSVGLVHQQHGAVPMGDFCNPFRIRSQAKIVGRGQEDSLQVRVPGKGRLHLFRAQLQDETPLFVISRLYIHRFQPCQDQSPQYAAVAVPGHQDPVSGPQGAQQHAVDHPGGPVHPQKAPVGTIDFGSQFLCLPDAPFRMVDVIQFLHQTDIAFQGHVPHQMAQGRVRSPSPLVSGGMERIYMRLTVGFHCRQKGSFHSHVDFSSLTVSFIVPYPQKRRKGPVLRKCNRTFTGSLLLFPGKPSIIGINTIT
jgi:hypothetical protein